MRNEALFVVPQWVGHQDLPGTNIIKFFKNRKRSPFRWRTGTYANHNYCGYFETKPFFAGGR